MTDEEQLGRNILANAPSLLTNGLDQFCEHIGRRARELLAKRVATREAVDSWYAEGLRTHADWCGGSGYMQRMILAALTHFAPPAHSLDRLCDGALRRSAKIVDPATREDVPSVEEIERLFIDVCDGEARTAKEKYYVNMRHAAKAAHAMMLGLAPRQKMMIDDMTPERWEAWIAANAPVTSMSARILAADIHRLANTPAEPAPDPDAALKDHLRCALQSLGMTFDDLTEDAKQKARAAFDNMRAVAAQKKE